MTFEEHYEFGHRTLPTWTFIAPRATGLAIEREEVDAHLARMGLKTPLAHEIREIHCANGQTVKALILKFPPATRSPLPYLGASLPELPRYFCLEHSDDGTVLGEWQIQRRGCLRAVLAKINPLSKNQGPNSIHINYGPAGEPEVDRFVQLIEEVLTGRREAHAYVSV